MKSDSSMTRKSFLLLAAAIAFSIGGLAVISPDTLLEGAKGASANAAARVMARTTGVFLLAVGALAFAIRNHADSPTLRAVLGVNVLLQLMLLPIDPIAYATGAFNGLASFVPNSLIHVFLAGGFAILLWMYRREAFDRDAEKAAGDRSPAGR